MRVKINRFALEEINNAISWYNDHESGLGDLFYLYLKDQINLLSTNPCAFPAIDANLRRYSLKKYPFNIVYKVEDDLIRVIAVYHQKRKPECWRKK